MKCPYCVKEIHFQFANTRAFKAKTDGRKSRGWDAGIGVCPACSEPIVLLREGTCHDGKMLYTILNERIVFPVGLAVGFLDPRIPQKYHQDYVEAAAIVSLSPKASAAISRRLLQSILRDDYKVKPSNLASEIQATLRDHHLPSYVAEALDAIRHIGNLAAHPTKNERTGEIVQVEQGEAEWLLEVLDSIFDVTFMQPKLMEERIGRLNQKLEELGRSPIGKNSPRTTKKPIDKTKRQVRGESK